MSVSAEGGHYAGSVQAEKTAHPSRLVRSLEWLITTVEPVIRVIAVAGILFLLFGTVWDVASRAITGRGVIGLIEVAEVILVITVYAAVVSAARDGQHIRVYLLTQNLPDTAARIVRSVGLVFSFSIACLLTWATTGKAIESFLTGEYRVGLVGVPVWPARVAIPIGMTLLALILLFMLLAQLTKYSNAIGRETPPMEDILEVSTSKDQE